MKIELTEAQFQRQVTDLAEYNGWGWMHVERSMIQGKWMTAATGPLGTGWPDLVLVRNERIVFAELKSAKGLMSLRQKEVLALLSAGGEVYVWRPVDWPQVVEVISANH